MTTPPDLAPQAPQPAAASASETLRPCPFCGGPAVADGGQLIPRVFYNYGVHCGLCGANLGKNYETRELATAAWNRRAH